MSTATTKKLSPITGEPIRHMSIQFKEPELYQYSQLDN